MSKHIYLQRAADETLTERTLTSVIRELIAAYADLDVIVSTTRQIVDDYRQFASPAAAAQEDLESES